MKLAPAASDDGSPSGAGRPGQLLAFAGPRPPLLNAGDGACEPSPASENGRTPAVGRHMSRLIRFGKDAMVAARGQCKFGDDGGLEPR
jgi:hypothetical protein